MRRAKRKSKSQVDPLAPPPEQMRSPFTVGIVHDREPGGALNLKGMAYRRRPMIDVLADAGLFTKAEHKALEHYRHHAAIADRSPMRDSLCLQRGGHGDGPTITMLNAIRLVADIEAAVGSLRDILRAVVVYDVSLSQWAIDRGGAIEKRRQRSGGVVVSLEPREAAFKAAKLDIRFAASRVEAELAA